MKTETQKVAAFRKRLEIRQTSWAIDIPARKNITLELTQEQQELLRRATKHVIPSVTLVFQSNELEPNGHALARLEIAGSPKKPRSRRKSGSGS